MRRQCWIYVCDLRRKIDSKKDLFGVRPVSLTATLIEKQAPMKEKTVCTNY